MSLLEHFPFLQTQYGIINDQIGAPVKGVVVEICFFKDLEVKKESWYIRISKLLGPCFEATLLRVTYYLPNVKAGVILRLDVLQHLELFGRESLPHDLLQVAVDPLDFVAQLDHGVLELLLQVVVVVIVLIVVQRVGQLLQVQEQGADVDGCVEKKDFSKYNI